ncbi:hypothetical protein J6590_034315 [Homalodisca vitripennis]|nr:hypothetical protein J6590_034315 [Homalodisca vitripennis]
MEMIEKKPVSSALPDHTVVFLEDKKWVRQFPGAHNVAVCDLFWGCTDLAHVLGYEDRYFTPKKCLILLFLAVNWARDGCSSTIVSHNTLHKHNPPPLTPICWSSPHHSPPPTAFIIGLSPFNNTTTTHPCLF